VCVCARARARVYSIIADAVFCYICLSMQMSHFLQLN